MIRRLHLPTLVVLLASACSKDIVINPGDAPDAATDAAHDSGNTDAPADADTCATVSCIFPTACEGCLEGMSGVIPGGMDCSRAVGACGAQGYEHCRGTVSCILDRLESGSGIDCAVGGCLTPSEPAAEDLFLCLAHKCGEVCGTTVGFPCDGG